MALGVCDCLGVRGAAGEVKTLESFLCGIPTVKLSSKSVREEEAARLLSKDL